MSSNVPSWYELLLLSLAAYRVWRFLGLDVITEPVRMWITGLPRDWELGDDVPHGYREWLASFVTCPYCLGTDVALGFWLAWVVWPHATLVVAGALAVSALVGALGHLLSE